MSGTRMVMIYAFMLSMSVSAAPQRGAGQGPGMARQFDPPPLQTILGTVEEIQMIPSPMIPPGRLGLHLEVRDRAGRLMDLHMGPAAALSRLSRQLEPGERIRARVYKADWMPRRSYVVQQISFGGETFSLRDEQLRPFWAGRGSQRGMGIEQRGMGMGQRGMGMEQRGMGMGQRGMGMEQRGMGMDQRGMGMGQRGMGMGQPGMGMGQLGMGMSQRGMGINQRGMGMDQRGMGMDQRGMGVDQRGMSMDQRGMSRRFGNGDSLQVRVMLDDYEIQMPEVLPSGPVELQVRNAGQVPHNIRILGQGIDESLDENLAPGESDRLRLELPTGSYEVTCPVGDHARRGMTKQLRVRSR